MPAKTNQRSPTRRNSGKTSARTASGRRSSSRGKKSQSAHQGSAGLLTGVMELISLTYFGKVILVLVLAALVILLNILLSRNQFDLFFRITGIEMVLIAIIIWLVFLLKKE